MIIGINFIVSGPEEKAKLKEILIPYIVGCVIIFLAFSIWKIAVRIGDDVNTAQYCSVCGDKTSAIERRRAKCSACGSNI